MKKILKITLFASLFIFFAASPIVAVATPQTTFAAGAQNCETNVLGVPPWYRGMTEEKNGECVIQSPDELGGLSNFIWKIVLNGIQIALVLAGWIAFAFILYGGFLFITGGGNSSQIEKARKSILNAVIGLIISMGAIAITNLVFGVFDGATSTNEYGIPEMSDKDLLRNGLNLLYYIGGIAAVIVIIIAGIMYVVSMGDSSRIARSKNMILYSVIGLGILLAAFAITNFVIERF